MNKKYLIVLLILFSTFVVLLPRLNLWSPEGSFYKYPIHANEWHSFTIAQSLEGDLLEPHIPYYSYDKPESFLDGSPLFHWIIYGFQKIGFGVDSFYILTLLQTTFIAITFFLFLSKLFDPLSSFLSTIFALSLESSLRWFGIIFFSPFLLSFGFFVLCLYLLHKHKKISILFVLSSLAMILTYPPFVVALGVYLFSYYFLINKKITILITPLILGLVTLLTGWLVLKGDFSMLVERFIYFDYLTGSRPINLINYLGIPLIVFGLYGFYKLIKKKEFLPFNITFIFFFVGMLLAIWPGYSFGFHYVRLFYVGCLLFMVYAGFGFYDLSRKIIKSNSQAFNKFIKIFLSVLVIIIIGLQLNTQIRTGSGNLLFDNFLNEERFRILNYLDHFKNKNMSILHPPELGAAITPMTGFKVTALPEGLVGGLTNRYYEINETKDCRKVENIIKEENYVILWLNKEKSCDFLDELINDKGEILYEYIYN